MTTICCYFCPLLTIVVNVVRKFCRLKMKNVQLQLQLLYLLRIGAIYMSKNKNKITLLHHSSAANHNRQLFLATYLKANTWYF